MCDYFSVKITKKEYEGKSYFGKSFNINKDAKGKFGKYLQKHSLRYDYILFKCFGRDSSYSKLYPQSDSIDALFCNTMKQNIQFNNYFNYLSPAKYTTRQLNSLTFTKSEMMLVASRFFYCDKVKKVDTGIGYHICVGINGIKELDIQKDLTALEAFCIEGIFNKMDSEKEATFLKDFDKYIKTSRQERKRNLTNLDDFLIQVRNDCFREMEQSEALQNSLLVYYEKNKSTINFTIQ